MRYAKVKLSQILRKMKGDIILLKGALSTIDCHLKWDTSNLQLYRTVKTDCMCKPRNKRCDFLRASWVYQLRMSPFPPSVLFHMASRSLPLNWGGQRLANTSPVNKRGDSSDFRPTCMTNLMDEACQSLRKWYCHRNPTLFKDCNCLILNISVCTSSHEVSLGHELQIRALRTTDKEEAPRV